MNSELICHIDGFNADERVRYSVQEVIEHHFYVAWRSPDVSSFKDYIRCLNDVRASSGLPLIRSMSDLASDQQCLAGVYLFSGDHGKKEFDTLQHANMYWSQCMSKQGALF